MIMLSASIRREKGTITNDASRLAARTELVWAEITTAADTMQTAWATVRMRICPSSAGGGNQPAMRYIPTR